MNKKVATLKNHEHFDYITDHENIHVLLCQGPN